MKTILGTFIALGLLAGAANAAVQAPVKTESVVAWGCGYGH